MIYLIELLEWNASIMAVGDENSIFFEGGRQRKFTRLWFHRVSKKGLHKFCFPKLQKV